MPLRILDRTIKTELRNTLHIFLTNTNNPPHHSRLYLASAQGLYWDRVGTGFALAQGLHWDRVGTRSHNISYSCYYELKRPVYSSEHWNNHSPIPPLSVPLTIQMVPIPGDNQLGYTPVPRSHWVSFHTGSQAKLCEYLEWQFADRQSDAFGRLSHMFWSRVSSAEQTIFWSKEGIRCLSQFHNHAQL